MINTLLSRFTSLYALWVIGASVLAFFIPGLFAWFSGPWITYALALIMLGMGLTLKVADFRKVWEMPRPVALGFTLQYTVMPATAWMIAKVMQLDPVFAVGLILVACCPGGTASNVVAFLARANVALSVVLTMASTLLAIVMTPLLMQWWAGQYVSVDAWGIFKTTFQVVLVPVVLGVFLNTRFPKVGAAVSGVGPSVAVVAITMIAGSIVARNVDAIAGHGVQLAVAGFLLHAVGFALGFGITRLLRFNQRTARTVSIEVGMQNSGLAMVLANQHFAAATATPAVFSSVFHTLVGSLCAAYWRMYPPTDEGEAPDPAGEVAQGDPAGEEPWSRKNIYYWKCDRPASFHGTAGNNRDERSVLAAEKLLPALRERFDNPGLELHRGNGRGDHLTFVTRNGSADYFIRVQDGPEADGYMEVVGAVLDLLERRGVPVCRHYWGDVSRKQVPFAYQVIEFSPFSDLNKIYKNNKLNVSDIAIQIGRHVATWQKIRFDGFGPLHLPGNQDPSGLRGMHERYADYFLLNWERHLHFLLEHHFLTKEEVGNFKAVVADHRELLDLKQGCLVHRDLALWNILGTANEVKAYIDWDDSISGDPSDDLSLLACFHDEAFLANLLHGYGEHAELPDDFALRFWMHLLRNMVVKSVIRVGSGYFHSGDHLFLFPPGGNGRSLQEFTRERLGAAYDGLCTGKPFGKLEVSKS